jgi:hypothetical protein
MVDFDNPRELKFNLAKMAKIEAIINSTEMRKPNERVRFTQILTDRESLTIDRFRVILWAALSDKKGENPKLEEVDGLYGQYVAKFVPSRTVELQGGRVLTYGAYEDMIEKLIEAGNNFLGPSLNRPKPKEKEPPEKTSLLGTEPPDSE